MCDFLDRNKLLVAELLRQSYRYHKICKSFLKIMLNKFWFNKLGFYGDVVFKFKIIVDKSGFLGFFYRTIENNS